MKDEIFVHDVKTFSLTSDKVREIFEWFKLALNLWIDRPCVKYDQRANSKRSIFLKIHVMRDSSNSKTIWMDWWTKSIRIDFISCLLLLIHACTDNMLHSGDMNWKKNAHREWFVYTRSSDSTLFGPTKTEHLLREHYLK